MPLEDQVKAYRAWVAELAGVIYNGGKDYDGNEWDKQTLASFLHMGDPSLDYVFPEPPPEKITYEDVLSAIDAMFAKFE